MLPCRLIVDTHASCGAWNMAVDESLLESAVHAGPCTVRIYRWSDATLSLGYFQPAEDASRNPQLAPLAAVRRLSGGGAIVHHHELTYSCSVPAGHPLSLEPTALYVQVHSAIIAMLTELGIVAGMRGETLPDSDSRFLCFGRGDRHDILLEGHKIVGSAQRRRRGAILQHGSVLMKLSEHAPEFPGLLDLTDRLVPFENLEGQLGARIAAGLTQQLSLSELTDAELALAKRLEAEKYRHFDWGRRNAEDAGDESGSARSLRG